MKVGIVVPFSWSFWGGVVDHADSQARALQRLGVDARLIMGNDPPGRLTNMLHPRPGRHDPPPDYVIPIGRTVIVPANSSLANIVLSPSALFRLRRLFWREQFDVVHVHEPMAPILSAYAVYAAPSRIVVTSHASGGRWFPFGRVAWGRAFEHRIDHRIAVSEQARLAASPYIRGPYEIIPNGVDLPESFSVAGRRNQVLFVGRHEPRKGLQVLLKAWPEVARATGARLRVVGADPLQVRFLIRRLGVPDDAIDILGVVPSEQLQEELRSAKALVAPSIGGESFGMVLTQAFSHATPVIASAIPGYTDVVDDTCGVLVPPGDEAALAAGIVRLLRDEPVRQALGAAGRARAEERYGWDAIALRLAGIYELITGLRIPARVVA